MDDKNSSDDFDDDFDDFLDDSLEDDLSDEDDLDSSAETDAPDEDLEMDMDADGELDTDFDLDEFDDLQDDDEWSEDEEGGVDESLIASNKKNFLSGLSFNTIVIIGAVIVGAIVMVVQISSKKPKPTEERFVSAIRHQGASDNDPKLGEETENKEQMPLPTQESPPVVTQENFLLNPDFLDSIETNLPQDNTSETSNETKQDTEVAQNDILTPMPETNDTPQQVPRSPDIDVDEEIVVIPEESSVTIDKFPNSVDMISIEETDTPSLLDIDTTETPSEIVSIEEPVEKTTEELIREGIQQKDDLIIETMSINEPVIKDVAKIVPEPIKEDVVEEPAVAEVIEEQPPEPVEPIVEEPIEEPAVAEIKQDEPPVVAYNKPQTKQKVVRSSRTMWDLRAVQPGKAWVSRKGTRNIQPVVIGDTLEGIGRITEISQKNGRWYVQGTKGKIRQ